MIDWLSWFFTMIVDEMAHGNFSFCILVVGILQFILFVIDLRSRKKEVKHGKQGGHYNKRKLR